MQKMVKLAKFSLKKLTTVAARIRHAPHLPYNDYNISGYLSTDVYHTELMSPFLVVVYGPNKAGTAIPNQKENACRKGRSVSIKNGAGPEHYRHGVARILKKEF